MKGHFLRHCNAKYQNFIYPFQKDIAQAKIFPKYIKVAGKVTDSKVKVSKARCLDGDSMT
jgi:hypothetical protein